MDSPISMREEHPYGRRRAGTKEVAQGAILTDVYLCAFVFIRGKCTNNIEVTPSCL